MNHRLINCPLFHRTWTRKLPFAKLLARAARNEGLFIDKDRGWPTVTVMDRDFAKMRGLDRHLVWFFFYNIHNCSIEPEGQSAEPRLFLKHYAPIEYQVNGNPILDPDHYRGADR